MHATLASRMYRKTLSGRCAPWVIMLMALTTATACNRARRSGRSANDQSQRDQAMAQGDPRKISGKPHMLKRSELTDAELRYGIAPQLDASVTYQPDVIIVGGGANSIRGLSRNGLVWSIDAAAPHARELERGKVAFVTGRAVGRVLGVWDDGPNISVVLGPVDITEIIRDANIVFDNVPIDFGEAIPYSVPEPPGSSSEVPPLSAWAPPTNDAAPMVGFASFVAPPPAAGPPAQSSVPTVPPLPGAPDWIAVPKFKIFPVVGATGIGIQMRSNTNGLALKAEAKVRLASPTLGFALVIQSGSVKRAEVAINGAAGLLMNFEGATDVGRSANVNERVQIPIDFSIPIGGFAVPIAATLRQTFIIKTAFGVRNTSLSATGDYQFGGGFRLGFNDGTFSMAGPSNFTSNRSLLESAGGVSLAPAGLVLAHQARIIVGVGALGFTVGPYLGVNSTVGVTSGSDLGMVKCKGATLIISLNGGVGYVIPKVVTDVINFFLRTLSVGPLQLGQIKGDGGAATGDPLTIINKTAVDPPVKACQL